MKAPISNMEVKIVEYRTRGFTFKEIADIFQFKHFQRARNIYIRALKKLRTWNDLTKNYKELIKAADITGYPYNHLFRVYSILKKNDILDSYHIFSDEELLKIPGIGRSSLEFLRVAESQKDVV